MIDFATEEFLNKNIRVRPLSGVTRGEDDGKTNDYNRSLQDHGQQDPDEKFHSDFILQIEENRREAKEKRNAVLERKRLEEEKAAKKRR